MPHHLIDVADPLEEYSAARYAREAAAAIRDITARGRLPILVGGTGLYYRALTRGFFPGPARDSALRARLERIADRKGPEYLHRWLGRVDPPSAVRIQPPRPQAGDPRARGVSPDWQDVDGSLCRHPIAAARLRASSPSRCRFQPTPPRIESRVASTRSLNRGSWTKCAGCWRRVSREPRIRSRGLVYRQALELLDGVRDEPATRELIVRENRRYARRQLIWFRKEPNLQWIHAAGDREDTEAQVANALRRTSVRAEARSRDADSACGPSAASAPDIGELPDGTDTRVETGTRPTEYSGRLPEPRAAREAAGR